jgi:hypothetical protein
MRSIHQWGKCKRMTRLHFGAAAAALLSLAAIAHAAQPEVAFIERFDGKWRGSGMVQENFQSSTHRISCNMTGQGQGTAVRVDGTCRAAVIFSRKIGAEVRYDPATGLYTGTYIGSPTGPARLSGKRQGDAINLTVTWAKPVNGNQQARMTIVNNGSGLRIVMTDQENGQGPWKPMVDINLGQS